MTRAISVQSQRTSLESQKRKRDTINLVKWDIKREGDIMAYHEYNKQNYIKIMSKSIITVQNLHRVMMAVKYSYHKAKQLEFMKNKVFISNMMMNRFKRYYWKKRRNVERALRNEIRNSLSLRMGKFLY
jgi:hypothetical protein